MGNQPTTKQKCGKTEKWVKHKQSCKNIDINIDYKQQFVSHVIQVNGLLEKTKGNTVVVICKLSTFYK